MVYYAVLLQTMNVLSIMIEFIIEILFIWKLVFENISKFLFPNPLFQSEYPVIPFHIYQTWHTKKDLLPGMANAVSAIKERNPEFQHHLFDDEDCRDFFRNEMGEFPGILEVYDSLIPGAYKADLWRYCILYKRGGIYLDIKFQPCDDFKFSELVYREHYVLDRVELVGRPAVYNAMIVSKAGNPILKSCIEKIISNVKNKNYGQCKLDVTGPTMMATRFPKFVYDSLGYLRFDGNEIDNYYIRTSEGRKLVEFYPNYREEQGKSAKTKYYHELWLKRDVFRQQA